MINYRYILLAVSRVVALIALTMLIPLGLSFFYRDGEYLNFLIPILIGIMVPVILFFLIREEISDISHRDAIVIVVLSWVLVSLYGAIPFYLSGYFSSFTDAFFETISGFTATGSTVLKDIESLPRSLLFWRSQTHWLGGMGIIVLSIAIFPSLSGKMSLFGSEAPVPPTEEKLLPRVVDVAKTYWKIYIILTLIEVILLLPVMGLFDAVTHSFASIAGGGFSTKNMSIAAFDSLYVEIVVMVFMIAGATSFILHYYGLKGRFSVYLKSTEFLIFVTMIVISTISIALYMTMSLNNDFLHSLRSSIFQVVSIITTTGFATEDFKLWSPFGQLILITLMFIGGMAASTSGSIKVSRYEIIFKGIRFSFRRLIHPHSVSIVKVRGVEVSDDILSNVELFFFMYIAIFVLSGLCLLGLGNDPATSFSAVAATMGNVGPGIGMVGPFDNFAHFSTMAKWILSLDMLIGRLEIWTVVVLFLPRFWSGG